MTTSDFLDFLKIVLSILLYTVLMLLSVVVSFSRILTGIRIRTGILGRKDENEGSDRHCINFSMYPA